MAFRSFTLLQLANDLSPKETALQEKVVCYRKCFLLLFGHTFYADFDCFLWATNAYGLNRFWDFDFFSQLIELSRIDYEAENKIE